MEPTPSPYTTPQSNVKSTATDLDLPFIKSWLMFFLIATVGGGALGAAAGAVIGGLLGASGASMSTIKIASGAAGIVLGLPISYFTFKWSVSKYLIGHPSIAEALGQKKP
jgi:hypothetical protein